MEIGINSLKDLVEIVIWLVGIGALIVAAYSYYISRKQLNFAVIVSCTERFQKIMPKLKSENENEKQEGIKQYIDLCNEELFYFKYGYLPKEIIDEWLDGMIYYLPHIKNGENVSNSPFCIAKIVEENLLLDYPRVKEAFIVKKQYRIEVKKDKVDLIKVIKENLKK